MSRAEFLRFLLFVGTVGTVFGSALVVLIRRARGVRPGPAGRGILALAAFGALCVAYGRFIEPYRLETTIVRIADPRIGAPLRIALLSDLHSDPVARLEERLPDAVRAARPDAIVFAGDAINSPEGLPVFKRCLAALAAIAPTYGVRGNWDVWYHRDLDLFGGTGARELEGASVLLSTASRVVLAGLDVESRRALDGLFPESAGYRVLLVHWPDLAPEAASSGVNLYLAGHTHGGQVALPLYGALLTLARFGKRFEAGLYEVGAMRLYVNRGIGMEGGRAPRVRFWARPELTVLELTPG